MSALKYDRHTFCVSCRPTKCDIDHRCIECGSWSTDQLEDYLRHHRSLESKCKKKSDSGSSSSSSSFSSSVTVTSVGNLDQSQLEQVESHVTAQVESLLHDFLECFGMAMTNPACFSAPSWVPNIPVSIKGGAGGDSGRQIRESTECQSEPPGAWCLRVWISPLLLYHLMCMILQLGLFQILMLVLLFLCLTNTR